MVNVLTGVGDPPGIAFGFRARSRSPASGNVDLELSLPRGGSVDVSLFDVRGRRVTRLAQGRVAAGVHPLRWNGTDERGMRVGSGVYFARARTPDGSAVLRIAILD